MCAGVGRAGKGWPVATERLGGPGIGPVPRGSRSGGALDASPRGHDIERYTRRVKERVKLTIATMRKFGGEK